MTTVRSRLAPYARVGGRAFTGLLDVTGDPAALDSDGTWVVVLTFEGRLACARFATVAGTPTPTLRPWHGPPRASWTSSLDRAAYVDRVRRIREAIARGDVYQVTLSRLLSAPYATPEHLDALAAALATGNPAPYAAAVQLPDHGVHVVSASPEVYLQCEGDTVRSRPIKGTARTPEGMLDKDVAENVMITDLVRNDLGIVADVGTVTVPELCAYEQHPGLVHLVSTVEARLRPGAGWADLLAATFPPGSVSGAPKSSALELIRALEPTPRGAHCGAVGWVDAATRTGTLAVAIRTFEWVEGRLVLGVGAGITWGSDPEGEWAETELKAARLLEVASS